MPKEVSDVYQIDAGLKKMDTFAVPEYMRGNRKAYIKTVSQSCHINVFIDDVRDSPA